MIDWMNFFTETIEAIHERLSIVLTASGCREGWLQGELFSAGRKYDLRVNEHKLEDRQTADLSCGPGPSMLAEIKIVAANYAPKMQTFIESDVARMRAVSSADTERYMILVIPKCDVKTKLGDYLDACSFPKKRCFDRTWPNFRVKIWQL